MKLENTYEVKTIEKPHPIQVDVPGSKSITNRALLLAALADGTTILQGVLFSDDSRHFIQALKDLQFPVLVDEENRRVEITGFGGKMPQENMTDEIIPGQKKESDYLREINVGSAGTAARFLAAFLGLSRGRCRMNSSQQMRKRPMKELLVALESLGAEIIFEGEDYHFPFVIGNQGNTLHRVEVDVEKSSQFLSALLITSVLFDEDFHIHVTGSHGMEYVKMTIAMMAQFGVNVKQSSEQDFIIAGDAAYRSGTYQIEPDLSAACYFYGMAPLLHVPVQVNHVTLDSLQGDIRFLDVLKDMGCEIQENKEGIRVLPITEQMRGGTWNLSAFSDQALTLAALAPFADTPVTMEHIGHIRYQECDRLQAIQQNLSALGIRTEEQNGTITIYPAQMHGTQIETYEDHRVAMAFTLIGLRIPGIIIQNPSCCRKTFETYFEVLEHQVY